MSISFRKLVNEKCKQCTYDPLAAMGNWRQQIEACTVKSCPPWPARPISKSKQGIKEADHG